MGMFFYVKKDKDEKCPYCGELFEDNFQSKRSIDDMHDEWGGCCERHSKPLPLLEKKEVENFYTKCENCKKWVEYENLNGIYKLINQEEL